MRRVGLKAKVIISVSLLVAAIIGLNAAITIRTERSERERQLVERGRLFARLTATDVARTYGSLSWTERPGGGNRPDLYMAKYFSYYPDLVRLMVLSRNGLVLYDSGVAKSAAPAQKYAEGPDFAKRFQLPDIDSREVLINGERYLDILAPVSEPGGPQFIKVRYLISFRSLEERLSGIKKEFILLAGFFMAVGIGAAAFFSAKLTNPILELKEGAAEIARGNLDHLVSIRTKDEIGELGSTFNFMARSLKTHRKDLEEANKSLLAANDELRELQKELIRSERMAAVGELAAGLSHEIDNPIGVILGFAELLLEDLPQGDPRREDLQTIVEESKRCKRIVRGLLDFSRPPVLGVMPTGVDEVVLRTVEAAKSQRLFKRISFDLSLSGGLPDVMADPDRLRQVFMNLLINAAQAMPDGGEIAIASRQRPEDGLVEVSFRDTGAGIPPEDITKVFQPFYTTKRPGEGTGLGLAICVRLLEEHGGSIRAESEPGKGSVFIVSLPLEPSAPAEKA